MVRLTLIPLMSVMALTLVAIDPAFAQDDRDPTKVLQRLGRSFQPQTGRLDLYESAVTDDDLAAIAALPGLRVLNLNITSISDRGLKHLQSLRGLEILYLAGTRVTDSGIQHLRGLTLRDLVLRGTSVGDDGLKHLTGMSSLALLYLEDTKVSNVGLKHLAGLTNLRALNLQGTKVSDAGLVHLQALAELESLELTGTNVTAAGLKHLLGIKNLRYHVVLPEPALTTAQSRAIDALTQAGAQVGVVRSRWRAIADYDERRPPRAGLAVTLGNKEMTDQDAAPLKELTNLQLLKMASHGPSDAVLAHVKGLEELEEIDLLCMTRITDKGMEHLQGVTSLRRIILDGTSVTDAGLVHLYGLVRLESIRLGKHVTAKGVADLRDRLPKTRVIHYRLGIQR